MLADGGDTNVIRLLAESPAAPAAIANYGEALAEMIGRIELEALESGDDPTLAALLRALRSAAARHPHHARVRRPLMPLELNAPGGRLRFLSAVAHFGTSEDVTVRDLRLELLFPADDATRTAMAALA
jgi:hypothetical protein